MTPHDLRAPVAAIEGYARALLDGRATGGDLAPKQRAYVEGILASCRVVDLLVENMRLAAALEAGRCEPGPGGDVGAVLGRLARDLGRAFEAKGARVRVEADGVRVARGADLIERIAANLLLAALPTSAEGRDVVVRAGRDGAEVVIALEAGGAGPGTGDGLRLVEEVARRLGGRAEFAPGRLGVVLPAGALE